MSNWIASTWAEIQSCHDSGTDGDTITVGAGPHGPITVPTVIHKHVTVVLVGATVTDNTGIEQELFRVTLSPAGNTKFIGGTILQHPDQLPSGHVSPHGVFTILPFPGGKQVLFDGVSYPCTNGLFIFAFTQKVIGSKLKMSATPTTGSCFNNSALFRLDAGLPWSSPSTMGILDTTGDNNAYFEGCELVNVMEGIDSNADGRIVSRFNKLVNSGTVAHDTTSTGSRHYEYYCNTFIHDKVTGACGGDPPNINGVFQFRMGTGILFGNDIPDITSPSWGPKNEITLEGANLRRHVGAWPCWNTISQIGAGYPAPRQPGWGFKTGATQAGTTGVLQDLEPIYLVNNTGAGNYENPTVTDFHDGDGESCLSQHGGVPDDYPYSKDYIQADREFYKQVPLASFDGSTGASQGTRAQMDAITPKKEGVGFWVTDEGNWNSENDKPGTPGFQKGHGQLYRANAALQWELHYTPFPYPHPLVSGGTLPPIEPPVEPPVEPPPTEPPVEPPPVVEPPTEPVPIPPPTTSHPGKKKGHKK